jgi:hypothetical protein
MSCHVVIAYRQRRRTYLGNVGECGGEQVSVGGKCECGRKM